uniref:Putative secreted protein n=1 Tax=Anopheles darlingi TaxID=43151 RepID=A0A2M4D750_ANODA
MAASSSPPAVATAVAAVAATPSPSPPPSSPPVSVSGAEVFASPELLFIIIKEGKTVMLVMVVVVDDDGTAQGRDTSSRLYAVRCPPPHAVDWNVVLSPMPRERSPSSSQDTHFAVRAPIA